MYLLSYHSHYFGMDLLHYQWTPWNIYMFYGETQILVAMIEFVRAAVGQKEEDVEDVVAAIEKLEKQSNIAVSRSKSSQSSD